MITKAPKIDRRSFIIGTAAVGSGLALGLKIPFGATVVRAQDGSPEINAWVVIRPDDTVVIRVARSEMGQGTITGLAQMVAEELECDWAKVTPPTEVTLKDPKDWKIIGKSVKRLDTMGKVTGAQIYGADLKLPGMLNAAIKDCPVFGGKVKSFEAAKVKTMPGVRHVLQVGDSAVAVVAETWWQAKTALDALPIVWDEGPNAQVSSATIAEMLKAGLDADQAFVRTQVGDVKSAIAGAATKVEAVYAYPFQNHAPMEPMNATAKYTPDRCEVWVPTQNGEAAFAATLAASGLPADKCEVYKINLGGGFGRRGAFHDYVTQAVLIAKQMPGTPGKLLWTRAEDMQHGRYHPVMQCKLVGAFDAGNNLTGLHMRLSGQTNPPA